MRVVDVKVGRGYNVYIGKGLLDSVGELTKEMLGVCTAAIITDDKVDSLYSESLIKSLEGVGFRTVKYVFKNGEKSKNATTFINILEFLAENHICRNDVIFALGGGVVGDIAGFVAATYLRGIKFVQVPTTLLAAVDSSVGGKTGIDLASGKNLAGAFYQPSVVICDTDTLKTLDYNIFCDGCAEVIKYGAIRDKEIFDMMKEPDKLDIESIITRCVEIKRDVVVIDEKEQGLRQILNFGHTFGHAVEKCTDYKISHGSAVATGMMLIMRACVRKGICEKEYSDMLESLLLKYRLPTYTDLGEDGLYSALLSDKKRKGNTITLVLPKKEGECELYSASLEEVREMLKLGL